MPTRISAGVGDHPCFLTFITMIPIDCKIANFSLHFYIKNHLSLVMSLYQKGRFSKSGGICTCIPSTAKAMSSLATLLFH